MDKVEIIEMETGEKYAVISSVSYENNEYILVTKVNETEKSISDEYEIFIRNREKNCFEDIEDETQYSLLKEVFERKLNLVQEN